MLSLRRYVMNLRGIFAPYLFPRLMQIGMSLFFTEKPILGYNAKLKGGKAADGNLL